ncbi:MULTISPECIES: hypothetical protein [unclassified Leisingera]|uniref:hypothetical protein n=1 Tax=unclassified Leisingera TaxID=2614906 RepID=UPI000376B8CF|nr:MULTISPECIES: hypothetical protein [unclassified Leisingera]KIC25674.1 hypothetical protein RA23_07460 [Leisingera sp. ANG-S3]KIC54222.1 hypothetical protein RA22_06085 [Leisingera sp. ANG-S]KID10957.1 hypothetical protein GC1_04670 [Leisingera sp. ANG1]
MAFKIFAGLFLALHVFFHLLLYLKAREENASLGILEFWFGRARPHPALQFLMLLASASTAAVLTTIVAAAFSS